MTSPSPYDYEAMLRALDELLPSIRMAFAKAKHINHPELKMVVLGLDDCLSDVEGLLEQYAQKRIDDLPPEPFVDANAPDTKRDGVW